jgi:hypothetical protein
MAGLSYDGVIEAARYRGGQLQWVRAYERRGATFSDVVLLDRGQLITQLQRGRRFVTGRRTENMAGSFRIGKRVQLIGQGGQAVVSTDATAPSDSLDDVPIV